MHCALGRVEYCRPGFRSTSASTVAYCHAIRAITALLGWIVQGLNSNLNEAADLGRAKDMSSGLSHR
jgi:hypothetical protein